MICREARPDIPSGVKRCLDNTEYGERPASSIIWRLDSDGMEMLEPACLQCNRVNAQQPGNYPESMASRNGGI
jgi:hypothetical protein